VFWQITGGPAKTVLAVQFGSQSLASQGAVEALLEQPGFILAVSIEANIKASVTQYVVHGPEPVVGAPKLASHHWMTTVGFPCDRGDFQRPVPSDRSDQLVCIAVRP
jgi:hypothetical protein